MTPSTVACASRVDCSARATTTSAAIARTRGTPISLKMPGARGSRAVIAMSRARRRSQARPALDEDLDEVERREVDVRLHVDLLRRFASVAPDVHDEPDRDPGREDSAVVSGRHDLVALLRVGVDA